ncbi:hypothetical protein IMSAGC020_02677 [Lachnospiraceae bacterium]|nr:hypothetical protein IMSAGC020_02677 [Lachnospiraceae bacterium]
MRIITTAIQPPAIRAEINALVPAIIALTAAMVALTVAFVASAVAFAVAFAVCAAFWAALVDAFAVFCAAFAVCSVVLIAVLDVAFAVFTPFSVALTVPLAVVLTVFSAFLAVVFIVRFPCCLVFISEFAAVWGVSVLAEAAETAGRLAVPCISCKPSCPIVRMAFSPALFRIVFCSAAFFARIALKSAILSFALPIFSLVASAFFCPCLLNWWMPSSLIRPETWETLSAAYSVGELSSA